MPEIVCAVGAWRQPIPYTPRVELARKIGQLFVVAARGGEPLEEVVRYVRDHHVGGVIWFASTLRQTAQANARLQALAAETLLISADLEAGAGMRFTDAIWWPPAMALAATGDPSMAEAQAAVTARDARVVGINHILAPVADVNVDPRNPVINTRSFGEDPLLVAEYVAAYVQGIQREGCLATAKHFPGHGDTHVDSHRALPTLDASRSRLDEVELVPFRAAIEAGVASIMIGHLAVPSLDPSPAPVRERFENTYGTGREEVPRFATTPATVSRPIVAGILRGELGFDGLIVSDAFDMGGLAAHYDPGEAAVRAIEAGEDQILYSADTEQAIRAVTSAVRSGRITEARLDESIERIRRARELVAPPTPFDPSRIDTAEHRALAAEIAGQSITLVRDTKGLLPLRGRATAIVVTDDPEGNPLQHALRELGFPPHLTIDSTSPADAVSNLTSELVLLLLALRPKSGAGRIALPPAARALAGKAGARTIAISFGSPYVAAELAPVSTILCAWGIQPVLQRAAIDAVRGKAPMRGRLPVSL